MNNSNLIEAPFEMANLFPKHTGLPFVVWISVRAADGHGIYVSVSPRGMAIPMEMTTVAIWPEVHLIDEEDKMDARAFALLKHWIELNRVILVSYWKGEIDTQDALEALTKV
jgi:hypothetical protein